MMKFAVSFTPGSSSFLASIIIIVGVLLVSDQTLATSCQLYPSEYVYHNDSVIRTENASVNCMSYPSSLQAGVFTEMYTHCNGSKLKLTDSNFGSEQYQRTDYYVWIAERAGELLFIFPTRVSLTTITLHYYSGSLRGLPRLRFYAVPDDFDVWDAPITSYPSIDVASASPGGELAGHRNISINVNFHTRRVLMYKYVSGFGFAVSEVEFFECNVMGSSSTPFTTSEAITTIPRQCEQITHNTIPMMLTTTESAEKRTLSLYGNYREIIAWVLVVILVVLLIVSLIVHVVRVTWAYRRNNRRATSPEYAVATVASNPCYEASMNLTEAQEAMHIYEVVKPLQAT